jgi:hypothetical protein
MALRNQTYTGKTRRRRVGGTFFSRKTKTDSSPLHRTQLPKNGAIGGKKLTASATTVTICGNLSYENKFKIKDDTEQNVLFTVTGDLLHTMTRRRMYIFNQEKNDAASLIAVVQQKHISTYGLLSQHYQVFCPTAESAEDDDSNNEESTDNGAAAPLIPHNANGYKIQIPGLAEKLPVYRFASIKKQMTSPVLAKYIYSLYDASNKKTVAVMKTKRKKLLFRHLNIKNMDGQLVGRIREHRSILKARLLMGLKNNYKLEVGEGNDLVACIILALVADTAAGSSSGVLDAVRSIPAPAP